MHYMYPVKMVVAFEPVGELLKRVIQTKSCTLFLFQYSVIKIKIWIFFQEGFVPPAWLLYVIYTTIKFRFP